MKTQEKEKQIKEVTPINLVIPNTIEQKMLAIVNVSRAIYELSKAISSTNVEVQIAGNVITDCPTGISIEKQH